MPYKGMTTSYHTPEMEVAALVTLIKRAKRAYYHTKQPIMEDPLFDKLLRRLEVLSPGHPEITAIGIEVPDISPLAKFQHTVASNSLAKSETADELRAWAIPGEEYIAQLKADGSTLMVYYVSGVFDKAVTRGGDDGIGEEVTQNAAKFLGIPKILPEPFTGAVRGEALLKTADFLKVQPDGVGNERNIGNGIVRRLDGNGSEYISFIAFNYEATENKAAFATETELQKVHRLQHWGFEAVQTFITNDIDAAIVVYDDIGARRKAGQLPYKIDGVVFKVNSTAVQAELGSSSGRPKYERVLKYEAPGAVTKVTGVVITIGHTGVIKPTASLEPVNIDNTSVKSAQLNNWDIIEAMDIAIGDTVRVVKAKDIIPYIEDVIERGENRVLIPRPVVCPVCSGEVKPRILIDGSLGSDLICQNNECDGRATRKVKNWIDKTRILYIGDMLLPILYERGITTPDKLYTLTVADLENIQTGAGILGNSNATKIIEQINKTRSLPLNVILGSMSIKHLGRRRAQQIMEKCPGQFDTIEDWLSDKLITLDVGMEGMAPEIAADIQNKRELIEAILTHVKVSSAVEVISTPVVSNNINFIGKTFVFTGKIESVDEAGQRYTRERLQSIVLENGGKVDDKIKKSTPDNQYYLVQADPNSTSSKTEDAKKKGASIIGEQEFWQMVK